MLRILLVEDEPDLADVAAIVLESAGYHVTVAHDGRVGLSLALQDLPEVIVTDFMMPGMDGLEMIGQLRQQGFVGRIVLCTAIAEDHLPGARGYDAFLEKPFLVKDLLNAISGS